MDLYNENMDKDIIIGNDGTIYKMLEDEIYDMLETYDEQYKMTITLRFLKKKTRINENS